MTTLASDHRSTATGVERATPRGRSNPLAGLPSLLRFLLRRDRVRAVVWVLGLVGTVVVSAASVVSLYGTQAERETYAQVAQADAAFKALAGPGYGLDDPTQGAIVMNETEIFALIGVALMAIFMLTRHTRAEEETDRAEMVRAAPIGRHAGLAAACAWVSGLTLLIGAGFVLGMLAFGLPLAGSIAFGATSAAFGLVFVGVTAVAAQLVGTGRAANALAATVLGVSFVLRAVGDMGNGWMAWLSPMGIAQAIRAYAGERWWVLALLLAIAGASAATAVVLAGRRDLGAGILPQRPGPPEADHRLASPAAMALRLQRVALTGWAVGIGLLGFFMGLIADQAEALAENEAVAEWLSQAGTGSIVESYLATSMLMSGLIASGFTMSAVLRMRSEEIAFRASPVLAAPVSRSRWMNAHLAVALGGTIAVLALTGVMTGAGYAVQTGDTGQILPLVAAGLVLVTPAIVLGAIAAAMFGLLPRWCQASWVALALAAIVGFLGESLDLPQWVRNLSPFEHVPALPAESFELLPPLLLTVIAVVVTAVGRYGFGRRAVD